MTSMKGQKLIHWTAATALLAVFAISNLKAQNYTEDQQAVWKEVENKWANWQAGDLDLAFNYVHEKFLGWNEVDALPASKEEFVNSMKGMQNSLSNVSFHIEPVKILVHQNSAVVHYTYEYSFLLKSGDASHRSEDHGKWSEFLVKEEGRWMLIGEFTFHHNASKTIQASSMETFTFSSGGNILTGRVYLPESYAANKDVPVVYLIDFTEQHFKIAHDEFEKVVEGVRQLQGHDAMVVSLANIPDIDAKPEAFQDQYGMYKDMAHHIDNHYPNNSSRTFIGKGSESGLVLMSLFVETKEESLFEHFIATDPSPQYVDAIAHVINRNDFPSEKDNKKLHFSFSTSNDRSRCRMLIDLIETAQYPWLQFEAFEYTKSDYENTYPHAYASGLRFVFE